MWDELDATFSDFIVNQLFLNMFRASLRPSSGDQTAFSLHMVICPVVTVVMLESRLATYPTPCKQLASRLSNITTVTTRQITICSENAFWPPEDGRKDARNMLRNNWLTIKSLIVASSWSHIYLLIKDARSLKHKVSNIYLLSWQSVIYKHEIYILKIKLTLHRSWNIIHCWLLLSK